MRRLALVAVIAGVCSMFAEQAAAQTAFVRDTFTVGSNQLQEAHTPDAGGAWTRYLGTSGATINAAADNVRNVATGDWNIYGDATSAPSAEHFVRMDVLFTNANANNSANLFGRGSAAFVNGYLCTLGANGAVTLSRVVGGVVTVLATNSVPVTLNVSHSLMLSLKNSAKEMFLDGVLVATSADNTVTATGIVGLGITSNGGNQTILDNFYASTFAPTAARVFETKATGDGRRTLIEWTTSHERDNLGFHLYRGTRGERTRITPALVGGSAFLMGPGVLPAGNTYRWIDSDPPPGARYWLEEIDLSGRHTMHGPIAVSPGAIDDRMARSPLLRELAAERDVVMPIEPVTMGRAMEIRSNAVTDRQAVQRGLAARRAVKIGIREAGWVRITRDALLQRGLSSSTAAARLHLFSDGEEVPIFVETAGSSWVAIRFHATGLDTPATDERVLWLASDATAGRRISRATNGNGPPAVESSFRAVVRRRDKQNWFPALRNGDAESFFGPIVSTESSAPTPQTLTLSRIDPGAPARLTVILQGGTSTPHSVEVWFNGRSVGTMDFDGSARGVAEFALTGAELIDGNNAVELAALNGEEDISVVESVAVEYGHTWMADNGRLLSTMRGGRTTTVGGFGTKDVRALDITDPAAPVEIIPAVTTTSVRLTPRGTGWRKILLIRGDRFWEAASLKANVASSIHSGPGAGILMIAHPDFVSALGPLVRLRRTQGRTVRVASIEDVYDEMSFGAKDPEAIRSLIRYAEQNWKTTLRSVLLVGDASFDPRNYLGYGDTDLVPTKLVVTEYLKTASDLTLADLDDDGMAEIPVGRLPVRTRAEADAQVAKILGYENAPAGSWRHKVVLVSDSDPEIDFHEMTGMLDENTPADYDVVDLDVATMGVVAARNALLDEVDDGAAIINFFGHGSVELWTGAGLYGRSDAMNAANGARLPVVLAMTCLNGYFHDLYSESLAEAFLRAGGGGAVAVWASSTLMNPETQVPGSVALFTALLTRPDITLGEATLAAQRASGDAARRTFMLFGDPSLRLKR